MSAFARSGSRVGQLARLGFAQPARADALLDDAALAGLTDPLDEVFTDGLPDALTQVADPDLALLGLVRLMEALGKADIDTENHGGELIAALRHASTGRDRLLAVLGASSALGDHLVTHPAHWRSVTGAARQSAEQRRDDLVSAVTTALASPAPTTPRAISAGYDALRVAYRSHLLGIAALDLTAQKVVDELPHTAAALADLAVAALEAALVIARAEVGQGASTCRFAVIGMGKCGGGELNYVSDVDVIFVAEPTSGEVADERAALGVATQLATALIRVCSSATAEGTLWPVDVALRPEGKNGPLVRTVASHLQYYERWAKTW
ncbi:MAG TPA: bifunctional glutamine-synthetase adenylyltransferase/deadenyltransferase, partial [Dermatophilaceae bacterium]